MNEIKDAVEGCSKPGAAVTAVVHMNADYGADIVVIAMVKGETFAEQLVLRFARAAGLSTAEIAASARAQAMSVVYRMSP